MLKIGNHKVEVLNMACVEIDSKMATVAVVAVVLVVAVHVF